MDYVSEARGHEIYSNDEGETWYYAEDNSVCERGVEKSCKACLQTPAKYWQKSAKIWNRFPNAYNFPMDWAPDPCIGEVENVAAACCGHGHPEDAYYMTEQGDVERGEKALEHLRKKE